MQVKCMNYFSFKNYGKLRSQYALIICTFQVGWYVNIISFNDV